MPEWHAIHHTYARIFVSEPRETPKPLEIWQRDLILFIEILIKCIRSILTLDADDFTNCWFVLTHYMENIIIYQIFSL